MGALMTRRRDSSPGRNDGRDDRAARLPLCGALVASRPDQLIRLQQVAQCVLDGPPDQLA